MSENMIMKYFLIISLSFLLVFQVYAEENQNWPKSVDEAVTKLVKKLPRKDKQYIAQVSKDDLFKFHFGWGTGIRNSFGLWRGNKELLKSCGSEDMHPDDASMVIIEGVWSHLRAQLDPKDRKALEDLHGNIKRVTVEPFKEGSLSNLVNHINHNIQAELKCQDCLIIKYDEGLKDRKIMYSEEKSIELRLVLARLEFRSGSRVSYKPPIVHIENRKK